MFGLFKKKIPASAPERALLVETLFQKRCETDPETAKQFAKHFGVTADCVAGRELMELGAPEYTLLSVVEQFLDLKDRGATDEYAIKLLNKTHSSALARVNEEVPVLKHSTSLLHYTKFLLKALHGHSRPMDDHFLIDAIQLIKYYYKR
jgi:hypothetical protein